MTLAQAAAAANQPALSIALLLGAAPFAGSFVATMAYRLPRHLPVVWGRSACPACGAAVAPLALMPIFGWLWQRGHCGACRAPISAYYPLVELAALAVAVWAAWQAPPGWAAWAISALGWALLALALVDARHFLLPDVLTLSLGLAGIALALALAPAWPVDAWGAAMGAIAGFCLFRAVGMVYQAWRGRAGLGLGDAKLAAAAGAWTGWWALPSVVLIAAVAALAVEIARALIRRRRIDPLHPVPFGVYLALGTWLVVLYGPLDFRWAFFGMATG